MLLATFQFLLCVLKSGVFGTVGKAFFGLLENYEAEFTFRNYSSNLESRAVSYGIARIATVIGKLENRAVTREFELLNLDSRE